MPHLLLTRAVRDAAGKLAALGRSQAVIEFRPDGTILDANPNFLLAMGYALHEVRGRHHSMFVDPATAASPEYAAFWDRLRRGEWQAAEYRRLAKDGREVWIQASYNPIPGRDGRPRSIVKFATDITQQVRAAAEARGQIEAIGKSQAVIHFALDGTVLDANRNFLLATGYALDEVVGRHHGMFVLPEERASPEYQAFWDRLRRGEWQAAEYRRLGKNGRDVWIQATYNPILDAAGRPFKVVKYASDVTAQVHARQRTEQLRAAIARKLGRIDHAVSAASTRSDSAAAASTRTAANVQAVASGAEQLSISVREISDSMLRSKRAADDAFGQAATADEASRKLTDAARSIGSIVGMIRDIAGRINLLSLNATIESARAGDAGRGFAVVANEVKTLANQASRATESIGGEVDGIRTVAGAVAEALDRIRGSIHAVQEHVTVTAGAVEQQSAVTRDMSGNMQAAAAAVEAICGDMEAIAAAAREADAASKDVQDAVRVLAA